MQALNLEDVIVHLPKETKPLFMNKPPNPSREKFGRSTMIDVVFCRNAKKSTKDAIEAKRRGLAYIGFNTKRIVQSTGNVGRKYLVYKEFMIQEVTAAWNTVIPLHFDTLKFLVLNRAKDDGEYSLFFQTYCQPDDKSAKKLGTWIRRVLKNQKMPVRKLTVSQSIPEDWRNKAKAN